MSNNEWVAAKRAELTAVMWSAAGIVRRRADMKEALQQLAGMHFDVQVRHIYRFQSCHPHLIVPAIPWPTAAVCDILHASP